MLVILALLTIAHADTPHRLSVMWRVVTPGHQISVGAVSPNGRSMAFVRHTMELPDQFLSKDAQKSLKQRLKRNPWLFTEEVMLVEPGRRRPRRIGYGSLPEFVEGGRALRYHRILKSSKNDGSDDVSRLETLDLKSGRTTAESHGLPGWTHVTSQSLRAAGGTYWASWIPRKNRESQSQMSALYVSAPESRKRRLLMPIPKGVYVEELFETPHGLIAQVTCDIPGKGTNPDRVSEFWRLGRHRQVLFSGRRPHGDQSESCTSRLLSGGKLLICESFLVPPTGSGSSTVTTRWWKLDPASTRVQPVPWKIPVEPDRTYGVMISPNGALAAVVSAEPGSVPPRSRTFRSPNDTMVATRPTGLAGANRLTVYRIGHKEPLAFWACPGRIDLPLWTPDSRGLILDIWPSEPFDPAPGQLVYLKLPSSPH